MKKVTIKIEEQGSSCINQTVVVDSDAALEQVYVLIEDHVGQRPKKRKNG